MIRIFSCLLIISASLAGAQEGQLPEILENVYNQWRHSIQTRNDMRWKQVTASHRQVAVTNRILSEKRELPGAIFDLPAAPPSLNGLKHLDTRRKGPTAKSYYYGKVDFGLGGDPIENLLVLSFVGGGKSWKFDQAEYVNLAVLPEIKKQLAANDTSYIKETPELQPSGKIPPTPTKIKEAQYIAKVYVYSPGREVRVQVNRTSMHDFNNAQDAQLIIGGAKHGENEIQYTIKDLVDEEIQEPMTIRIYLMSQVNGVKPVKVYEYQVKEGEKPKEFGKGTFVVDQNVRNKLLGK